MTYRDWLDELALQHGPWYRQSQRWFWRQLLAGLAVGYGTAVWGRNQLFTRGWRRTHRLPVPVVSVGNLSAGGTGKTPLVEWLARQLLAWRLQPVVLSRGYRRSAYGNDETQLLRHNLPQVPVFEDRQRWRAGQSAIKTGPVDVFLLDDGFQHQQLVRDLNLVLLDASDPHSSPIPLVTPGGGRAQGQLLPAGLLRESFASLRRADWIFWREPVATATVVTEQFAAWQHRLAPYLTDSVGWLRFSMQPTHLEQFGQPPRPLSTLAELRIVASCGIGRPGSFWDLLASLRSQVVACRAFPDHHHFSAKDCQELVQLARQHRAAAIVITQKDAVKLSTADLAGIPLWVLRIAPVVQQLDTFLTDLARVCQVPTGKRLAA